MRRRVIIPDDKLWRHNLAGAAIRVTAAVPTRIEKWLAALPHANVFVLAHLHRPCAAGAGRAAVFGLYFGVRRGIVIFDRAAKPIYCFGSPVVANRGASYFWIWRWPKVRELFLIIFAGQRGCLFPHLHVSCCWIKECRTLTSVPITGV